MDTLTSIAFHVPRAYECLERDARLMRTVAPMLQDGAIKEALLEFANWNEEMVTNVRSEWLA